jgi:hypothetical protein
MADWTTHLSDWSVRGVGAIAGASVSLVYLLPKKRQEALSRFVVGVLCGVIFGHAVGSKLMEWMALEASQPALETTLMGATAASFASWWALGLLVRLLDRAGSVTLQSPDRASGTDAKPGENPLAKTAPKP